MTMKSRIVLLLCLSVAVPLLLRWLELRATVLILPLLEGTSFFAPDMILLLVAGAALALARLVRLDHIGFSYADLRLTRFSPIFLGLPLIPSLLMTQGISVSADYAWLTTSVAEEVVCRGLWFAVVIAVLRLPPGDVRLFSYPVLLSSLFFLVWHIPPVLSWQTLGFIAVGVYKSLSLGILRAHSRSLYPCILVHSIKLIL